MLPDSNRLNHFGSCHFYQCFCMDAQKLGPLGWGEEWFKRNGRSQCCGFRIGDTENFVAGAAWCVQGGTPFLIGERSLDRSAFQLRQSPDKPDAGVMRHTISRLTLHSLYVLVLPAPLAGCLYPDVVGRCLSGNP